MEWEAMHRPLEPPPGYEHLHTVESVFPGMRGKIIWPKNLAEWRIALGRTWRLYKHYWVEDEEMAKFEESLELRDQLRSQRRAWKMIKRGEKYVKKGLENAKEIAEEVAEEVREGAVRHRPDAERFVKSRTVTLRESLDEFAAGYQEVLKGETDIWGNSVDDSEINEDWLKKDNRPVVFTVGKEKESNVAVS